MTDVPPPPPDYRSDSSAVASPPNYPGGRLIARVKGILLAPKREWTVIAGEAIPASAIYLRYVAPLAAVGAVASVVGATYAGVPLPSEDASVRIGIGAALAGAAFHFALTFVTVFIVALIVNALAPTFGGQRDALRSLKVTAYSFTPAWVAAILMIMPSLGALGALLGLYGLYLLYLGLPLLMHAPIDKSLGYTVVVVICTVALSIGVALAGGVLVATFVAPDAGIPGSGIVSASAR